MSQTLTPGTGFNGDVPANLACGFCKRPIQGEFYRALNKFTCPGCAAQVQTLIAKNSFAPEPFARAAAAGLGAALGCAAVWAVIVQVTHYEIGIVASLIGFGVGKAVHLASGRRRGRALQWLAAALSIVGVIGGKVMMVGWQVVDAFSQKGTPIAPLKVIFITVAFVVENASSVFGGFDLLWVGFAVYAAWRLCQAPPITIGGPYPHTPSAAAAGLQFHTVEPAPPEPASPAEPPATPEQP